ncbi:hypothetical protein [Deinococcus sp.]|uniref:hypothetical protein n=1 Tax=Deinococcus sp. TaxID=47478 RepID=UPI003C7A4B88
MVWAVICGLALSPVAAQGVQVRPVFDMTLTTGWTGGAAVPYDLEQRAAAGKASTPITLVYTPTPALKKATVEGYVNRLKGQNPAASRAVAANFGPGKYDYSAVYSGLVKGNGLNDNDAAGIMTALLVLGYMIVNDVQDGNRVTPAMMQGVRAQFRPQLSRNFKLTAPGVAGRLGQEMKLQTVIVQGGWQSAIKAKTLPAYQRGIAEMFKTQ